ncbi:MAG TPA: DnaJ domain-containing protein [Phycisphaerae bacterium]|nr:DnaJ domain-containing protein [Phycisphaerae bacterium]
MAGSAEPLEEGASLPVEKDYYAILGIAPGATAEEIRLAFLHKAMECHPDRGGTHEKMVELSEAVEILADPEKRSLYDRVRSAGRNEILVAQWRQAEADATARARSYPENPADFSAWLDAIAADVQKTTGGRMLTGLAAGLVFGAVVGFLAAWYMAINPLIGAGVGCVAGAVGGVFAAASNESFTARGRVGS